MRSILVLALLTCALSPAIADPDDRVAPDLDGMTLDQAQAAWRKAGFKGDAYDDYARAQNVDDGIIDDESCQNGTHVGTVCMQWPRAHDKASYGADVSVQIGRATTDSLYAMPNLVGVPLDKATALLAKAGSTGKVNDIWSGACGHGVVCRQLIAVGKKTRVSARVTVWIGK